MNDQINKAQILTRIQTTHAPLETILAQLTEEQMLQPGVESKSSVKDILAHITAWEQHLIRRLQSALHEGKAEIYVVEPDEPHDTDSVNELIFVRNQHLPLHQVRSDFHRSFQEVLQAVEALSDDDLFNPQRLAQVFNAPVERIIGSDTFYHYPEHTESIRGWLAKQQA